MEKIGHDGSRIIWPENPEPYNRMGFHSQECMETAMLHYGVITAEVNNRPAFAGSSSATPKTYENFRNFHAIMDLFPCVLLTTTNGKRHAYAWDTHYSYDPATQKLFRGYPLVSTFDSLIAFGGVDVSKKFSLHF